MLKQQSVKYFTSKTKNTKQKNKKTKNSEQAKVIKKSKPSSYFSTILRFKANKRWKRSIKKRRKLLRPFTNSKSQIAIFNLKYKNFSLASLKLYMKQGFLKKRSTFKTLVSGKQVTHSGSWVTHKASEKNRLQVKFYNNAFLKFHHEYQTGTIYARRLKKRKLLLFNLIRGKQYKKNKKRSNMKKFKHRVNFVKSSLLLKTLYIFRKKKSILSSMLSNKKSNLGSLSYFKLKSPLTLSRGWSPQQSQFISSKEKQRSSKFTKMKKLAVRLPSWKVIHRLKKSNQAFYSKVWNAYSKGKKVSFTRALPFYQSHTTATNTFKQHTLNCIQLIKPNDTYLIPLLKNEQVHNTSSVHNYLYFNIMRRSIDLSKTTYNNQFNDIVTNTMKNYNVMKNSFNWVEVMPSFTSQCPNPVDSVISKHNVSVPKLLNAWLLEKNFIFSRNIPNRRTINVLSRVPNYKMNLYSPVSADRFRGNIHGRLSIINLTKLANQQVPSFLTKLNTFSYLESFKRNTRVSSDHKILFENANYANLYYIKYKAYRLFLRSALKRKFFKDSSIIKTKKIIKNKRKRKLYAINRTARLHAAHPVRKFYKSFVTQLTIGKKKNMPRTSVHKQRSFRVKYLLRLRFFRKSLSDTKKKTSVRVRLVKNMLYFSHTKLRNECKTLNEFRELNFKRKRFLMKNLSPNTTITNTVNNNFFVAQKTKRWLKPTKSLGQLPSYNLNSSSVQSTSNKYKTVYNNPQLILASLLNITLLKTSILNPSSSTNVFDTKVMQHAFNSHVAQANFFNNLIPDISLRKVISKTVINSFKNNFFQENVISWYHNTMIRFIEDCTGKKTLFQFYPFMSQDVTLDFVVRYKRWLPRMVFYERRLGHRFFLEEAIHIIHLSFYLKDPKIICSWLKAMILRISFWKTRSIFRFLKYLFFNYFQYVFKDIGVKGLKIRLKGKISAAGNSRKRTILYRIGNTSHSTTALRVLNESTTINTFTGVMGFNVWLFY